MTPQTNNSDDNNGQSQIIDFLNECEEQDYWLDGDDIRHILKLDFDYVRKQHIIEPKNTADLQRKFIKSYTKGEIGIDQ